MITEQKFSNDNELLILSHMIMDGIVLQAVAARHSAGELKNYHFTDHNKKIFNWVLKYYENIGKPPKKNIKRIWNQKKKSFSKDEQVIIEQYLNRLSDKYIFFQEESIESDYIQREVIPNFIREKEIQRRIDKAQKQIDKADFEDAEKIFTEYKPISNEEVEEDLGVILPLTVEDVTLAARKQIETGGDIAYEFDEGDLKDLVGPLKKSWLVAVSGVEKSGKSYLLDEIGFDAAIYKDKKVLKINLELSRQLQRLRTQKRISRTCDKYQKGENIYPILDCENNQFGTCKVKEMQKKINKRDPLISHPGEVVYFQDGWEVCDFCRRKNRRRADRESRRDPRQRFIPTVWFESSELKEIKPWRVKKAIRENPIIAKSLPNFRVKCFPRYSVSFDEIRTFIFRYIEKFKWEPDILIIDYVDILAQQDQDPRMDVDKKWKKASQIAGELNCLVLNADQAVKAARTQYMIDKSSTSESKTKDAHLDVRIALNQTDEEKDVGIARINVLFHRHKDFSGNDEVMITQRIATSEPILDNVRIFHKKEKKFQVSRKNL